MNDDVKSFVVYDDIAAVLDELSDEQIGQLFRGMVSYHSTGEDPGFEGVLRYVFIPIKQGIDRNDLKYAERCERNRKNIMKRYEKEGVTSTTEYDGIRPYTMATNTNTNNNTNTKTNSKTNTKSAEADVWLLSRSVISYLNEQAGTTYKTDDVNSVRLITGLLQKGYTEEQMKTVIDKKVGSWLGDPKVEQYLRPSTLFGQKFEQYLNEPDSARKQKQDKERKKAENREKYRDEIKGIRIQLAVLERLIEEADVPEKINLRIRRDALEARLNDLNRMTGGPT